MAIIAIGSKLDALGAPGGCQESPYEDRRGAHGAALVFGAGPLEPRGR
jgi:hypothetical protein